MKETERRLLERIIVTASFPPPNPRRARRLWCTIPGRILRPLTPFYFAVRNPCRKILGSGCYGRRKGCIYANESTAQEGSSVLDGCCQSARRHRGRAATTGRGLRTL